MTIKWTRQYRAVDELNEMSDRLLDLNRGWSIQGKRFREMEKYVATHVGTFFYHGALYDDETWIPASLEYGVLREDGTWWIERFHNRTEHGEALRAN